MRLRPRVAARVHALTPLQRKRICDIVRTLVATERAMRAKVQHAALTGDAEQVDPDLVALQSAHLQLMRIFESDVGAWTSHALRSASARMQQLAGHALAEMQVAATPGERIQALRAALHAGQAVAQAWSRDLRDFETLYPSNWRNMA